MAIRLGFFLLAIMAVTAFAKQPSCMLRRTLRAGVPLAKARVMEERMKTFRISERLVTSSAPQVVAPLLQVSVLHVQAYQQCITQRSKTCKGYAPCHFGGKCHLSAAKRLFECKCTKDYTGHDCSIPHPAPIAEFRVLERKMKKLIQKIESGEECIGPYLSYTYKTLPPNMEANSGKIFSIPFVKKRPNTAIRISVTTSFRSFTWVTWYVTIDGQRCTAPADILSTQHQSDRGNTVTPGSLAGVCTATSRGRIGKGRHVVSVHIHNPHGDDALTGWKTNTLFEVFELCM